MLKNKEISYVSSLTVMLMGNGVLGILSVLIMNATDTLFSPMISKKPVI